MNKKTNKEYWNAIRDIELLTKEGFFSEEIKKLAKKIKINHALALELWQTDILEARQMTTLIIDVKQLTENDLDRLVCEIRRVPVADWMNSYVVKNFENKETLRLKWLTSKNVFAARAGWNFTASKIAKGADGMDLSIILNQLEKEMPTAAPEVQWTMNFALAETGIHHPTFRKRAIEIGEKLGIFKDYPTSKGCTSPFAPIWINEMVRRSEEK